MAYDNNYIVLSPVSGDNAPQIQSAVNSVISTPGFDILLLPGTYSINSPIIMMNGTNGYFSLRITGKESCKNSPSISQAIISPTFNDKPAFIVQKGKDVFIENLAFKGLYTKPNSITVYQLQTMKYADWATGDTCRHNYQDPYCAIAIDPFCDPSLGYEQYPSLSAYYISGISTAGSTGVNINGCYISNFVVGVANQTSAQQNGDMCMMYDTAIEYCKVCIAYCQPQNKGNILRNMRCWGATYSFIDTYHFGQGIGVMPFLDGLNMAGGATQIFYVNSANRFTGAARFIYAESIFKIGVIGGCPVPTISDSFFDFMNYGYSPDFYVYPFNSCNFNNCTFRIYNGGANKLNFSGFQGAFIGGGMEQPILPAIENGGSNWYIPEMYNVTNLDYAQPGPMPVKYNTNSGITTKLSLGSFAVSINTSTYLATVNLGSQISNVQVGDYLCAGEENTKFYEQSTFSAPITQLGRIISIAGNVATMDQVSIIAKNQSYNIYRIR